MPPTPPTGPTAERFLQSVARSGLLSLPALRAALDAVPPDCRADAERLAECLVRRGDLSRFQAAKLLQGAERGLVIGAYRVLAPLGKGGMGAVYLARDSRDESLVALKVLPPRKAREEERLLARFRREMDLAARVDHPNITRTRECGTASGVHFIAMEYIPGKSLHRLVAGHGPRSVAEAARHFASVAAGLAHAHGRGLIHRDLKPSNIMITPEGEAKVLDLGLAMRLDEELPTDRTIVGGQGYVVGTMDYIAPEQAEDPTAVTHLADIYSFGCSLYYALTGRPPFPGGTSMQKIMKHRTARAEPVEELNPDVPADFARIVRRLMSKDPSRRPASADETRDILLPWAGPEPSAPPADGTAIEILEESPTVSSVWDALPPIPLTEPPTAKDRPAGWLGKLFGG